MGACGNPKSSSKDTVDADADPDEKDVPELDLSECEDVAATDAVNEDTLNAACACFSATLDDCNEAKDLCADTSSIGDCVDKINEQLAEAAEADADSSTGGTNTDSGAGSDDGTAETTEANETSDADAGSVGDLDVSQCDNGLTGSDALNETALDKICDCFDADGASGCVENIGSFCEAANTVDECIELINEGVEATDDNQTGATGSEPTSSEEGGSSEQELDLAQCNGELAASDILNKATSAIFCDCFDPEDEMQCTSQILDFCQEGGTVGECLDLVNSNPVP